MSIEKLNAKLTEIVTQKKNAEVTLNNLKQQYDQTVANINALNGAEQVLRQLIAEEQEAENDNNG